MPPTIKVDREIILEAALRLVREEGIDALTARGLSKRLGCSVQPLFREFENMESLRTAVILQIWKLYHQTLTESLHRNDMNFSGMGIAYIRFARSEPRFFRLLFMSDGFGDGKLEQLAGTTEGDEEVITLLSRGTGLSPQKAQILYTSIWLTTHGIASMLATNSLKMSEEEARILLARTYRGLVMSLNQEETEETP